jgi:hypothetical protein
MTFTSGSAFVVYACEKAAMMGNVSKEHTEGWALMATCKHNSSTASKMEDLDGAMLFCAADDGSIPLRPGETVQSVLAQRRDLELHSYYRSIENLTFPTRFVPVSVDAAAAWRIWNRGGTVDAASEELSAVFQDVENRVREFVDPKNGNGKAFVRLSTRSPKDAVG